jgi:hypothetical protein
LRVQRLPLGDQVLVLARVAESRVASGRFGSSDIDLLLNDVGLPRPPKTSVVLARLGQAGLLARLTSKGSWRLTPAGRSRSMELLGELELVGLLAEAAFSSAPSLGSLPHPVIPPEFAPPELLAPLRQFLDRHPFERNVFGMTRFPDQQDLATDDPIAAAIDAARDACESHGLEFHLASDRAIADDLWSNVAAHMWACKYGIAFFEDRRSKGLNYNLTIEVGSMLITGRRCALLKDVSIKTMPTDLVGRIYKAVDMELPSGVVKVVHAWLRDDVEVGSCAKCP